MILDILNQIAAIGSTKTKQEILKKNKDLNIATCF